MTKQERIAAQKSLPALGCDMCRDGYAIGYLVVQPPGQDRYLKPCECRVRREQAQKALVQA